MGSKKKNNDVDKYSEEYREKRMKNNVAVKRSRDKSKAKAREAQTRVQQLQSENEALQNTVDAMTAELRYLKEMLISQAGTDSSQGTTEFLSADTVADLEDILHDESPTDLAKLTTVLNEMKRIHTVQVQRSLQQQQSHQQQPQQGLHHDQYGGGGGGGGGGAHTYQTHSQGNTGTGMYSPYDPNVHYPL